jgi:hypothetical protein
MRAPWRLLRHRTSARGEISRAEYDRKRKLLARW